MNHLIYADHAATTQLDSVAFEAMKPFLIEQYGNASQLYSFSRPVKAALKKAREVIAACIGAQPEEIYFTSGGTESDNWAIKGSVDADTSGGRIITSQIEHHAVLNSCKFLQRTGKEVVYLPVDNKGVVSEALLNASLIKPTALVSVMLANNEVGTIQDIPRLAKVAHAHGTCFHTDAVQAVGHISVNVQEMDVDMLSASAHKFNGPKGIGFLYIKNGTCIEPYLNGGAQESGLRAGTENVSAIVGMAAALKNHIDNIQNESEHLLELEDIILTVLRQNGVLFRRNGGEHHLPGNLSLSFPNCEGEALLHRLDLMGICVSTGAACDSKNTRISHVLQAMDIPEEYAVGTIRISLGYENTEDEVERIARSLIKIMKSSQK